MVYILLFILIKRRIILVKPNLVINISKVSKVRINDNDLNGPNFDQEYIELIEENKKDKVVTLDSVKEKEETKGPIKKSSKEKVKDKLQTKTVKKRSVKTIDVTTTDEHVVEL